MTRLLTAEQVCETFGVPSPRTVRTMRGQGLASVLLGKAYLYDSADVADFIQARKTCPVLTPVPNFAGSRRGAPTTSSGSTMVQDVHAQRARQIAEKLKRPSRTSSSPATKTTPKAPVSQIKSA
jgi:hypothetical protein